MNELSPGLYETLITGAVERGLEAFDRAETVRMAIDPGDAHEVLTRHLATLVRRALKATGGDATEAVIRQVQLANEIAAAIATLAPAAVDESELVSDSRELLLAILRSSVGPTPAPPPARPDILLSQSALLINGKPSIGTEVQKELESADRVDLLCAFVKWTGVRIIEDQIARLIRRGGQLRVITTTYIGATERRAVDRLAELGAEVRISYETRMTRLHAKAWLFHRATGFSTAYVGSSNLSKAALIDGLEWNVRLSAVEQGHLLDSFQAAFDDYWEDAAFEPYDPANAEQRARLDEALAAELSGPTDLPLRLTTFDVRPWGYQQEILDALKAEREVHNRWHNLVVMATGTGKTVLAGLDYRRLREAGKVDSLLFVAHRQELLSQSLDTFRQIMRDGSLGEMFVAGARPSEWRHVFASVQSLARLDLTTQLPAHHFDMVVVDEFHHASKETQTYASLLRHLKPKVLLGLTATPERADGGDVLSWFDGRIAVELRLWEALERGLLAPFQYFGISDGTDLTAVRWKRGVGYDVGELTNLYTGHDARLRIVLRALRDKVTDVARMRALGFCVSIEHANFMADRFNRAGIPARAVTSATSATDRAASLHELRAREINILFTVDLFNEGVDVPEIDTALFLRPTESATVFLQQLGRGLRLADGKPCLTVLDFIGNQRAEFRYDLRYRSLSGVGRRGLEREIRHGFPTLPPGCHIELDRVATETVLQNVTTSLRIKWSGVADDLRALGPIDLTTFLDETGLDLDDIYRRRRGGWAGLRRAAGQAEGPTGPEDDRLAAAFGRMLHIDDLGRLDFLDGILRSADAPQIPVNDARSFRRFLMLHFSLWGANEAPSEMGPRFTTLWANNERRAELIELAAALRARVTRVTQPDDPNTSVPLYLHARYSRDEALAAFGLDNPASVRQGVKWIESERADVFFVTLRKTEDYYSPTTMYQDRAMSPSLFQWESQSTTSTASPTGQRYAHHCDQGSTIHLFLRETREADGDMGAPAYLYAGRAKYVSHSGDRPMRILWKLDHDLPPEMFHAARVAVG